MEKGKLGSLRGKDRTQGPTVGESSGMGTSQPWWEGVRQ